jgi:hypothetical protein
LQRVDGEPAQGDRRHSNNDRTLVIVAPRFPFEGRTGIAERDEPDIGDDDAMSIPRQTGQHSFRSAERPLRADGPFGIAQGASIDRRQALKSVHATFKEAITLTLPPRKRP